MGILFSVLSLVAVLGCFVNPIWAGGAYFAINIIRPNEHYDGVLFPTIPAMIFAAGIGYMIYVGRQQPRPKDVRQWSPTLIILMMSLLAVHLLIWRREELIAWFLGEFTPVLLFTIYATRHFSTPQRVQTQFAAVALPSFFIAVQAFVVHFFLKGAPRPITNSWGVKVTGYGSPWDDYHFEVGHRLHSRNISSWGNPNDFAMVCNWAVPGALYLLRQRGRKLLKIVGGGAYALLGATILLTGSRGGLLQLAVTSWVLFIGGKRKALGIVLLVVGLVGVIVVLPRLAPERTDASGSKDERVQLQLEAVSAFIHSPIKGVGFLNFPDVATISLLPHNVYLQCLAETGLVGSTLFFLLLLHCRRETKRAMKFFNERADDNFALLARCINGLQFSFLIFMLFTNQFMRYTFGLVATLGMPLYLAMARVQAEDQAASKEAAEGEEEPVALGEPGAIPSAMPRGPMRPVPRRAPVRPRQAAAPLPPALDDAHLLEAPRGSRYVFDPEDQALTVEHAGDEDDDDER